ncbi:Ovarian cancer-associated protein 2 [Kappamyces sp. JEL0829]|nr:Ovarian cancer-associated protein 2 [Kappamyces sp. JEL0829]
MRKILWLHGYGQNAEVFKSRTAVLHKQLAKHGFSSHYLSGPHVPTTFFTETPTGEERAWWNSNQERTVYHGYSESVELVTRTNLQDGPFDGIIGFSQGACLTAMLGSLLQPPPQFLIIIGGFVPNAPSLASLVDSAATPSNILHVMGENDEMVPLAVSRKLHDRMGGEIYLHDGGHIVPSKAVSRQFLVQWIERAVSGG